MPRRRTAKQPYAAMTVCPPQESTIEAILVGMLGNRARGIADGLPDGVAQFWGLAARDERTASDQIHTLIDPAECGEQSQVLEHAARFLEELPHLWGYGLAWVGWIEAFASPADVPPEAKIAALFGTLRERPAAEEVVGATIYDTRGVAHTSYVHMHVPDLGVSTHHIETCSHTTEMLADFRQGSLVAHTWAAALSLDPVANGAVIDQLRAPWNPIPPQGRAT